MTQNESHLLPRTSPYIGNHYEVSTPLTTTTKYYYFGAQRVAMNQGGAVTYLHTDHLGSTSVTSGATSSTQVYYPFGGVRASTGTLPTDFTFTGQKIDASDGLMYYGARYYDAALGRFISADTITPNLYNPQNLNRYAYVLNNPLKYTDPNGHAETCGQGEICGNGNDINDAILSQGQIVIDEKNVDLLSTYGKPSLMPAMAQDPIKAACWGGGWSEACDELYGGGKSFQIGDCEIWNCPVGSPVDYGANLILLAVTPSSSGVRTLVSSVTKQEAKALLRAGAVDVTTAQAEAAAKFLTGVGKAEEVVITQSADGTIEVTAIHTFGNESVQNVSKTIDPFGETLSVIQNVFDKMGNLIHYDIKFPK